VLFSPRRFQLVAHMMKTGGRITIGDVWQILNLASYSAANRHVDALARADVVDVELAPHPHGTNRTVKTLILTDTGRAVFEAQCQIFKEMAAA
jgi:hypothetical protein